MNLKVVDNNTLIKSISPKQNSIYLLNSLTDYIKNNYAKRILSNFYTDYIKYLLPQAYLTWCKIQFFQIQFQTENKSILI